MTKSARVVCPVCGANLPVGSLRGHVASDRCVKRLARECGREFVHPDGERIYMLARKLDLAITVYRKVLPR